MYKIFKYFINTPCVQYDYNNIIKLLNEKCTEKLDNINRRKSLTTDISLNISDFNADIFDDSYESYSDNDFPDYTSTCSQGIINITSEPEDIIEYSDDMELPIIPEN